MLNMESIKVFNSLEGKRLKDGLSFSPDLLEEDAIFP
jgi:hypothetical protein